LTIDTALRLARYFGVIASFWMWMQTQYDLERAHDELTGELKRIAPVKQAAA
jgi:plasmid maintenance system antidote protein VapI